MSFLLSDEPPDEGLTLCAYCTKRRAVNMDHVFPRSVKKRLRMVAEREGRRVVRTYFTAANKRVPPELFATVPVCMTCNVNKMAQLLVPPSWADRIGALDGLGIGKWRIWRGVRSKGAI